MKPLQTSTFELAVEAARDLPEDVREVIGACLFDQVRSCSKSLLSDAQRAEVRRRLANLRYAFKPTVDAFFARHGIAN